MIHVIPSKYLLIGTAVIAFAAGWTIHGWKTKADERDQLVKAIDQRTEREAKALERAEAATDQVAAIAAQNRAIKRKETHETRDDAYRCPLPASGVRLLNEARTGVERDAPSEPDKKVP